jgi:hypothetical protein
MPSSDWKNISTKLAKTPAPPPDTARVFAVVAPLAPVGQPKAKRYSTVGELEDDGWGTGFSGYNAMATIFAQTPFAAAVSGVVMISRETAVAEAWTVDLVSTADDTYRLFEAGVQIAEVIAVGNTDIEIRNAFIADLVGSGFTGAIVDDDTLTVTNDDPGVPFVLTSAAVGTPANAPDVGTGPTTPAVGVYDDLDEAYKLIPYWGVLMPGAADYDLDEARRWRNADTTTRRSYILAQNSDAGVFDVLDTDNLAVQWQTISATGVTLWSHPNPVEYFAAAMVGVLGGTFPGARAWHRVVVSGIAESAVTSSRTSDETATAKARNIAWSERLDGPTSPLEGVSSQNMPAGNFIFQQWAADWWWYTINATVDRLQRAPAGIDMTDIDLQRVASVIKTDSAPLVNAGVLADVSTSFVLIDGVPEGEVAIGDYKTTGKITYSGTITPKLRALAVEGDFEVV